VSLVEFRAVRKAFGPKVLYRDLSLAIERGETLTIIGGSGCGKSVLLKILIGLLPADGGEVRFDGHDVTRMRPGELQRLRQRIGMLFQGSALFDSISVGENVAYPLREHHVLAPDAIPARVRDALAMVGLERTEALMPAELSGGMRKRAALARALVLEPRALLYDEPTTGLDPVVGAKINHLIRDLQRRLGVTSVVVTHDLKSAFFVADRIAFLHEGCIRFAGPPDEARASRDPFLREFLDAA
jgi:phospholipid/cholesterol/gamma-HCH transport system ATP-binding protein